MSESMRAYCIKWSVAFTTNCQLSGLSICPVQQCSPVPESPYGSPHLLFCSGHCSRAQMMRIFVCTCKIICECQDTRFRLSDWGMSGECICGWSLLQCSNPTYSHDESLISSLMIWWLAACCSSPLVRVIVLPCLVVSIIPVYSSSPARMLPLPSQSPAPPGLILMVLSKIHLAAQLRCQRRSLHSTLFYTLQHTATVTASVEMFFGSFRPKGSLLMLILFMQVVEQWLGWIWWN